MTTLRHHVARLGLAFALAAPGGAAAAQSFALLHSFHDPGAGAQPGARQGYSVALEGNFLVVGAPNDDVGANDAGVVNVYNAATGALLHSLTNPRPAAEDLFGTAVAVSGTRIVVGASQDEAGAAKAGSAFVFDLAGVTPRVPVFALTNPAPDGYLDFGFAVGISGSRVVVGAKSDNAGAYGAGSAFVFDLSGATPTVPAVTLANPTPALYESFGTAVAISGTRVVVGALWDDAAGPSTGSAYVYELAGPNPGTAVTTLVNPEPWSSYTFGQSVALWGDRVVVGARFDEFGYFNLGRAYVFDLGGATPTAPEFVLPNPTPLDYEGFGVSVGISGTRVVVGAMGADADGVRAGCAYLYELAGATPTEPAVTLTNATPAEEDRFGFAVTISGARAVVGAPLDDPGAADAGVAWAFDVTSATPDVAVAAFLNRSPTLENYFGTSVGISGSRLVVGTPHDDTGAVNAGSASVFHWTGATPAAPILTLLNPSPDSEDQFGTTVAISGTTVVVAAPMDDTGAEGAGSVYVYDLMDSEPGTPVLTLNNPHPATNGHFGWSVALSGSRLMVGAPFNGSGTNIFGRAYLYDLNGSSPNTPERAFNNPSPHAGDAYGWAVGISGARVVVGAPYDTVGFTGAGSAYVYDVDGGSPGTPILTLNNPEPAVDDRFGWSVAVSGARVVVGAAWDNPGALNAGSVYVYDADGASPDVPVVTLYNPMPGKDDFFGCSVGISGTRLVVGAFEDATGAANAGSAFVFDLNGTPPEAPESILMKPAPMAYDGFGTTVAIDGATAVAGAPFDDTTGANRGAAYLFSVRPALSVEPDDPGFLRLSWSPADVPGFVLQYTDSLASGHWVTAPSGAANPVTVPATNAARFYRVAQP